uniref:Uncharacterized protein n=1 Tax=Ditylenchus dipsaci TaxID=166011 RepID=A0A915DRU7_9BILA
MVDFSFGRSQAWIRCKCSKGIVQDVLNQVASSSGDTANRTASHNRRKLRRTVDAKPHFKQFVAGNAFTKFKAARWNLARTNHALDEKAYAQQHQVNLKEELWKQESQTPLAVCPSLSSSAREKNNPSRSHRKSDPGRGRRNVQDIDIPERAACTQMEPDVSNFSFGRFGNAAVRKREAHRLEQGNESVNIFGCLSISSKTQEANSNTRLSTRNQETEFALRAKSLAFVPPENIWNDFRLLKTHLLAYDQALAPSSIGLKHLCRTAMRDPMFPVCWWSCYERTLAGKTERITLQRLLIVDYTLLLAWIIQMWLVFLQDLKKNSADSRTNTMKIT